MCFLYLELATKKFMVEFKSKLWPWSCKTKIVKCKITVKDFEYTINQILHISQIPVLNFDKVFFFSENPSKVKLKKNEVTFH